ncbi:MAG: ROK family protein, partial [Clostridia bacterium]|nr:ROK family protein [Clostridia bacterium]
MNAVEKRKQIKRNNVLKVIRASDEVSRFVIKKVTKYSMTTILNIVDSLIKEDLITEEMSQDVKIGRTPIYLNINPKGQYFIGIEFNADVLKSVAIDFNVDVIYSEKFKMDKGMSVEQIITLIKTAVNKALEQVPYREKVAGIGIGVPGYVDKKNGIALEYSYFNDWNNVEIKKIIEEEFAIDVYIDNNINALTYHYKWVNPKEKDFIVVSMQYGTRLGIVLNNDIFIGSRGNAGEIGHTKVRNGNRLCSCGKIGCLDSEI